MSKKLPSFPAQAADMAMQMALRQIDFRSAPHASAPPAKAPPPQDTLALRRQEWLMDVQERQRALSPYASGLLTAENLSGEDFLHSFYAPGRPVLIRGQSPTGRRWNAGLPIIWPALWAMHRSNIRAADRTHRIMN